MRSFRVWLLFFSIYFLVILCVALTIFLTQVFFFGCFVSIFVVACEIEKTTHRPCSFGTPFNNTVDLEHVTITPCNKTTGVAPRKTLMQDKFLGL